jgi:hypothetical protein
MNDLIARLTAATGPDAEIDAAIEMAIDPDETTPDECLRFLQIALGERAEPPTYTDSIDAALKLVPDGWRFYSLERTFRERWVATVQITNTQRWFCRCWFNGKAATVPLAVCIAAMKARAG